MQTTTIDKDIKVFYVTAKTFPEGILDAHKKLFSLVSFSGGRRFFGISRPENGVIVYRAAAEEMSAGEAEKLNCETLTLQKGKYACITINNFSSDIQSIDRSFQEILSRPDIDPNGYCVEWYFNDTDVKCMVRLREN